METHATFSELHELLKLAKHLREAAAETEDSRYTTLFLETAASLEKHAKDRTFGPHGILVPRAGHYFPDTIFALN
jgi:hypothetical protein